MDGDFGMEFETNVTSRDDEGNIIGADVNFYDDSGNIVHRVVICEEQQLQELSDKIDQLDTSYVKPEQLTNILQNTSENTEINATKLNGLNSGSFALRVHTHSNYANQNHASNTNNYGLGDDSKYGHVKTRNNLNAANFISGEALSAYQGALLGNRTSTLESLVSNLQSQYYKNSLQVKIGKWSDNTGEDDSQIIISQGSGDGVYAKLYCDDPNFIFAGKEVVLIINGIPYIRTSDTNGKSEKLNIQLGTGVYTLNAFINSIDGFYPAMCMKIIKVE